jgi:hypothetical protein
MKKVAVFLAVVLTGVATITVVACSDPSREATGPTKGELPPVSSMPGASADGTAAPSVPSATQALKAEPVLPTTKAASGGTDDMKKPLTKAAEETQMPLVGHGNNHSAPDNNAADADKPKG